ncbi:MAG: xanthine dehydrogenase family protein subunit M [Hyphomicrobiaceae bacterium]|nr:xanthine dehydrogenase family protein subunit M [Hyphomicrobiaceae bacterium]
MKYEAPQTLDAAVRLLAGGTGLTKILAGGTDLLVQIRTDLIEPDLIVDIKGISEVRAVTEEDGGFRVGAAVTGAELAENAAFAAAWPGVLEGCNLIGSTQVQGRATMGGNLCNGSPAADSVPGLIAAGAVATIAGPNGTRQMPVEEIMVGPRKLAIGKDEFVVSFSLPARPAHAADAYLRFIPRTEMDIAVVGCAVNLTVEGGDTISDARVSLGAVAPKPLLVADAAKAIIGTALDESALKKLGEACSAACNPIDDKRGTVEFRTKVAAVLAQRTAKIAYERARSK